MIDEKERLFRLFKLCLYRVRIRGISNQRTIANEISAIRQLMEMPKAIGVNLTGTVPLGNSLSHRDGNSAYTALIPNIVSVVKSNLEPVYVGM